MRWNRDVAVLGICGLLTVVHGIKLCIGNPYVHDEAFRIIVGAAFILLVPGLLLGQRLRFTSRHPWETVSLAFILSMIVEMVVLVPILAAGASITAWAAIIIVLCAGLWLDALRQLVTGQSLRFLGTLLSVPGSSFADRALSLICLALPVLATVLAYRLGEGPYGVGAESDLHCAFVRLYREMPLVLSNLGIDRGAQPQNLIHWWEFILAGWSRLANIDPLPLFYRARFVAPFLGGAGMYWLARSIFGTRQRASAVFITACVLCLSGIIYHGSLSWIPETLGRFVMAFLGTSHHADVAIDILLPLSAAAALQFFSRRSLRNGLVFVGVLVIDFALHPREFIQTGYYVGLALPTLLAFAACRNARIWKAWLATLGVCSAVAIACLALSASFGPVEHHGYDELAIKSRSLELALQPEHIVQVRSLLHFPFHMLLSSTVDAANIASGQQIQAMLDQEWRHDPWLILTAVAIAICALFGRQRDRRLAVYLYLLWLLTLCWNSGMFMVAAITYSEFYMSTPRLLHVFGYLVIGSAIVTLAELVTSGICNITCRVSGNRGDHSRALSIIVLGALGWLGGQAFAGWMNRGDLPLMMVSTIVSCIVPVLCCLAVILDRLGKQRSGASAVWPAIALSVAFFFPFIQQNAARFKAQQLSGFRGCPDWWGVGNPHGISPELMQWTRSLSPGQKIFIMPGYNEFLSVYSPQYLAVLPVASVIRDVPAQNAILNGSHFLSIVPFNDEAVLDPANAARIDHVEAYEKLRAMNVDYILISNRHYDGFLQAYVRKYPETYVPVFENAGQKELVVRVVPAKDATADQ